MAVMQRIVCLKMTAQEYARQRPHEVVSTPLECVACGRPGRLHRHGIYARWFWSHQLLEISVARFLCPGCGRTTSLLPDFALSYRLIDIKIVDLFFRAEEALRRDFSFAELLRSYWRRWEKRWFLLLQNMGNYLGRLRIRDPCHGWKSVGDRAGGIAAANRILIEKFAMSLLGQYAIHTRKFFHVSS